LLLLGTGLISVGIASQDAQVRLSGPIKHHQVDPDILDALKKHSDPVDALVSLHPEMAGQLALPRLLRVSGESTAKWMTEGDKLRLKRQGKKFVDITDHEDFYKQNVNAMSGEARTLLVESQRSPVGVCCD
jgi:leucyl aminopeptidase